MVYQATHVDHPQMHLLPNVYRLSGKVSRGPLYNPLPDPCNPLLLFCHQSQEHKTETAEIHLLNQSKRPLLAPKMGPAPLEFWKYLHHQGTSGTNPGIAQVTTFIRLPAIYLTKLSNL